MAVVRTTVDVVVQPSRSRSSWNSPNNCCGNPMTGMMRKNRKRWTCRPSAACRPLDLGCQWTVPTRVERPSVSKPERSAARRQRRRPSQSQPQPYVDGRFPGQASAWTALLRRSQPAWLFPPCALPHERLAGKPLTRSMSLGTRSGALGVPTVRSRGVRGATPRLSTRTAPAGARETDGPRLAAGAVWSSDRR